MCETKGPKLWAWVCECQSTASRGTPFLLWHYCKDVIAKLYRTEAELRLNLGLRLYWTEAVATFSWQHALTVCIDRMFRNNLAKLNYWQTATCSTEPWEGYCTLSWPWIIGLWTLAGSSVDMKIPVLSSIWTDRWTTFPKNLLQRRNLFLSDWPAKEKKKLTTEYSPSKDVSYSQTY